MGIDKSKAMFLNSTQNSKPPNTGECALHAKRVLIVFSRTRTRQHCDNYQGSLNSALIRRRPTRRKRRDWP
jgi:hypothetical protein